MKTALITGITGQDGAYLVALLLAKGYTVHGIKRRTSLLNTGRIDTYYHDMHRQGKPFYLHYGDVTDSLGLSRLIGEIQPDEIYHLAAMSHVKVSFEMPEYTSDVDALGTMRILEAVRILGLGDRTRIYQASTSEMYGKVHEIPQRETTPFHPRSPYAVAKVYAYWMTVNYREAYGMYCCNGILFNHESPLRGETFVTRKITRGVAAIFHNQQQVLYLGNLDAKRDWGHAKDYVEAMWRILQQDKAEDYVVATGVTTTVRAFVNLAFSKAGIVLGFEGTGEKEYGKVVAIKNSKAQVSVGDVVVRVDPLYFRPAEVEVLLGDASKAKTQLGWQPTYDVDKLCEEMVQADMALMDPTQSQVVSAAAHKL